MPVAAQIGGKLGDHDQVADAGLDGELAAGAQVALAGGVRLDDGDVVYPERTAHNTNPTTASRVIAMMAMSVALRSC